jgi:hypothetical protein
MKKPKVLNRRKHRLLCDCKDRCAKAVYIGRPSKWGNPYEIGRDGDRDHVIMRYKEYLKKHPELIEAAKRELKGKSLLCWCAPQRCHGDVLFTVANGGKID